MTNEITAAVFRPDHVEAQIESIRIADLREDEVLVRLVATGICHTDLTCRSGFMPMPRPIVLGHEGAGIVERVGSSVTKVEVGDRVVLTFLPCGKCKNCVKGVPAYCLMFMPLNFTGRRIDGSSALADEQGEVSGHFFGQSSFATHSVANERNVIKVRADAPLEILGPLGCGIQTGAGSVMNVLKAEKGDSIVICGAGGVGLAAVMAAVIAGCAPIIVVEPNAARRALAVEVGATHVIDPSNGDNVLQQLQALAGEDGIDKAFDTSGIPQVIADAIEALGPRGQIALVTGISLEAALSLPLLSLIGRGITIRGVNMGDSVPEKFIPKLVDLIMEGRFPLEKLVRFYEFSEINHALEDQEKGVAVKPILTFGNPPGM